MGDRESFDAVRSRQIDADNAWAKAHIEKAENWLDDQADRQRALIPPNDHVGLLMHDGTLGIVKTAYHLAKGLLGLAMDVGRLKDDPVYRENVAQKVWNGAVWLAKEARISQGSQGIEGIQDQNERVIAFSKGLWDKAKKGWKEAGTKPGHQTQLVVEIAANIALFFVGGEAATAARAEKLEEGAAILEEVTQPCKTVVMSNEEILAEIEAKMAAAKAAEEAAAAADAAKAAAAEKAAAQAKPPVKPETLERLGPESGTPNNRSYEHPYRNPPEMIEVKPGTPLDLSKLDPEREYLWAMKEDGTMRIAPKDQAEFLASKQGPQLQNEVKHGDLFPGPNGLDRGQASVAGELRMIRDSEGKASGVWELNNDSSFTFLREDGATTGKDQLQAVSDVLGEGGTDTSKILVNNSHGAGAR